MTVLLHCYRHLGRRRNEIHVPMKQSLTAEIVRDLERQGARIENARAGRTGAVSTSTSTLRFPVKVFPPNGSPMFTIHQTVGDWRHEKTLDATIRRAGLASILSSNRSPEEPEMSSQQSQQQTNQPMQHERTPPGVAMRKFPLLAETIARIQPVLDGLPATFWTDEVLDRVRAMSIPGYNSGSSMVRLQGVLDFLGFRVVESKVNRGGFSYRWVKDPNAEVRAPAEKRTGGYPVVSITPKPKEESASTIVSPGPIAQAMADAERARMPLVPHPGNPTFTHARVTCAECGKTFTADAYAKHVADSGHNEPKPELTVTSGTTEAETVSKADYDAMEQMAAEAEQRAVALQADLETLQADLDQAITRLSTVTEHELALRGELSTQVTAKESALELVQDLRTELGHARLSWSPPTADDSWLITPDESDELGDIRTNAASLGLQIEVRARRA